MFLHKHISGLGFLSIQLFPWDFYFQLRRQIQSVQTHYVPLKKRKEKKRNGSSKTSTWGYLSPQYRGACRYHSVQYCYSSLHIRTLIEEEKKKLALLLIQKGRIPVPKITAWNEMDGGGQIIGGSNLWKADNKTHLKWLQCCYWHGEVNASRSSYP